jgi:putative ATPase
MAAMIPLAERLRPKTLSEVVGQQHILEENALIPTTIRAGRPLSILLWGPPGCGKTTIARCYAKAFSCPFVSLSAVFSGVADLKKIIKEAQGTPLLGPTLLFVDEIHRFNKVQQDAFLPYLEDGTLVLVGATTENPSFSLNDALLSRLRVLTLRPLDDAALDTLLAQFEAKMSPLPLTGPARLLLRGLAQGDGRYLFNMLENLQGVSDELDEEDLQKLLQKRSALSDRGGEQHYNLISALHKAVRGSDPDAALYWFYRMLEGGEDPLFLARRLIRMASEDIGLADPQALQQAITARDAFQMLGSPEGELALAQAVVYCSLAPKSNALYMAANLAKKSAAQTSHLPPPDYLLNAPTAWMKKEGYGKGYVYDHDTARGCSGQNYFPQALARQDYYRPVERGFEREMVTRLRYFQNIRDEND